MRRKESPSQKAKKYIKDNINRDRKQVILEVVDIFQLKKKSVETLYNEIKREHRELGVHEAKEHTKKEEYVFKYKGRSRQKFIFDDSRL